MPNTQHTPGAVEAARIIMNGAYYMGTLYGRKTAEGLADLIDRKTAAPDLLKALQNCLPDLQHYASTHGPGPDKRLEAARAAIAEAGKEHKS